MGAAIWWIIFLGIIAGIYKIKWIVGGAAILAVILIIIG